MPMMYTAGELRAWHRGYRARRLEKPYKCASKNPNYLAAWRSGWFAAERAAQDVLTDDDLTGINLPLITIRGRLRDWSLEKPCGL